MDSRPIGIFDSGLGGLTAVKRLRALLPGEDIVFLGDTANVPYGSRDAETLTSFARADLSFLRAKGVKCVAAVCGSVSSNVKRSDLDLDGFPFFDLITPTAEAAASATHNGTVGLIATVATVSSGRLAKAVVERRKDATVIGVACPELASLIEAGHTTASSRKLTAALRKHLAPIREAGADTLILGCTHYPLVSGLIRRYVGDDVVLIDSGAEEASSVASYLAEHDMLAPGDREGSCSFFLTAEDEAFRRLGSLFLGEDVSASLTVLAPGQFP